MPELPEVEITRRRIAPILLGRTIASVYTTPPSYFFLTPPRALARALIGRKAVELTRHGKYLIAELDDGKQLLLHLGMTGQLFSSNAHSPRLLKATARAQLTPGQQRYFRPDLHTHLRVMFTDQGPELYFRDVRKFGKVGLLQGNATDPRLARLGPDALSIESPEFFAKAKLRKVPIKSVLLDQAVLAGAGNIYADEALFLAKLRPTRRAQRVTKRQCDDLLRALKRVLERAIQTGGSSINDFIAPDGQDGHYQDERLVYARTGLPCKTCQTPIQRVVLGQRSTHFCPNCQR